ncbi:hypothetical protein EC968_008566 [Mortierella alpina]|nr:hypothetical protein EC968_008566 [Mortierella alpina]
MAPVSGEDNAVRFVVDPVVESEPVDEIEPDEELDLGDLRLWSPLDTKAVVGASLLLRLLPPVSRSSARGEFLAPAELGDVRDVADFGVEVVGTLPSDDGPASARVGGVEPRGLDDDTEVGEVADFAAPEKEWDREAE